MDEIIYDLKDQLLEQIEKDVSERGIERLDKEKIDMVKDLAEASAACWKAEYYRGVSQAMEDGSGYNEMGYGYNGQGGGGRGGSSGGSSGGRSGGSGYGYRASGRGSANQYGGRRGYGMGYDLEGLKMAMQSADPQEKERMRRELQQIMSGQM